MIPDNRFACLTLRSEAMSGAPYLIFEALAAEHGDCIVLSYGDSDIDYRLVVDVGVKSTANRLRKVLDSAPSAVLELLVVSHIDDDHIGGVLSLLEDQTLAGRFEDVWFNGRQHLDPPGTESFGVRQGIALQEALADLGISWNKAFDGCAVRCDADKPVRKTLASGAIVTVLSPTTDDLAKLRVLWDRWVQNQAAPVAHTSPGALPTPQGLESMGGKAFDIPAMAVTRTKVDTSAKNGSSIAVLFEYGGRRILLCADAHSKVLVDSAAQLTEEERLGIDVLKLPHHGSEKNVTERLMKTFFAKRYVLSTNGSHHEFPDDVAIARVVNSNPDAELVFNYAGPASGRWQEQSGLQPNRFSVLVGKDEDGVRIVVL